MYVRGMIPPVPTFLMDGRVDEPSQRSLVERLRRLGVDGVLALGTAGEGPVLDDNTRDSVVRVVVDEADGMPVVVGCGTQTLASTSRQIARVADLGAAAALVLPPFYFALSQDSIQRYFLTLADQSPIPLLLYHIPVRTDNPLAVATVRRLAEHPQVVGMKDSGADFKYFQQVLIPDTAGEFVVFQGVARLVGESLTIGARDTMCTVSALMPQLEFELRREVDRDPHGEPARTLSGMISEVAELFGSVDVPMATTFKAVASFLGLGPAEPHDRAVALTEAEHEALEVRFAALLERMTSHHLAPTREA